jgi:hypothetical protein
VKKLEKQRLPIQENETWINLEVENPYELRRTAGLTGEKRAHKN